MVNLFIMSTKIKFLAIENHLKTGAKSGACVATVVHNRTWSKEDIACEAAKRSGLTQLQANAFMEAIGQVTYEGIAMGNKMNFGPFGIGISMKGSLKEANSRFDPAKNELSVFFAPSASLKKALEQLDPENATQMDRPWLYEVACDGVKELNRIVIGSRVVANGNNIRIDSGKPDEGVWLESAAGEKLAKGEVVDTDNARLVCIFRAPLGTGAYRLALYTRACGAANGAVAVIRRRVKVV